MALAHYLFGDRIDELLARYDTANGTAWYLTDNLGTVRDLVDDAGDLLNHIDYDSFGRIIAQSNASAGDRFTYTGREWDAEIGLYYYRARFYDAGLGRFISQDPIGFAAGDANLYRYVGNGPVLATDPYGETTFTESSIHMKEEAKTAPGKAYLACVKFDIYVTVAFAAVGVPPDLFDVVETVVDCMSEIGAPGSAKAGRILDKMEDSARLANKAKDSAKGLDKARDAAKAADRANDSVKLTRGGQKVLRDPKLRELKDKSIAEAILERGGVGSTVQQVPSHLRNMKLGEAANRLASKFDKELDTAIKLVKQARDKAQKYGGKG